MQIKRKRRFQNVETAFSAKWTSNIMLMSRTVAQPVAHNERAGMLMKVVLKAVPGVRCVVCWCDVLCCVVSELFRGTFLEQLVEPFDGGSANLLWHGTGSALLFLYVSSRLCPSFRIFSRFSPPLRAERVGRRDDFLRFFPSLLFLFASLLASPRLCGRAGGTTFDVSSRLFSFFRLCTIWSRWIYISFCNV